MIKIAKLQKSSKSSNNGGIGHAFVEYILCFYNNDNDNDSDNNNDNDNNYDNDNNNSRYL